MGCTLDELRAHPFQLMPDAAVENGISHPRNEPAFQELVEAECQPHCFFCYPLEPLPKQVPLIRGQLHGSSHIDTNDTESLIPQHEKLMDDLRKDILSSLLAQQQDELQRQIADGLAEQRREDFSLLLFLDHRTLQEDEEVLGFSYRTLKKLEVRNHSVQLLLLLC